MNERHFGKFVKVVNPFLVFDPWMVGGFYVAINSGWGFIAKVYSAFRQNCVSQAMSKPVIKKLQWKTERTGVENWSAWWSWKTYFRAWLYTKLTRQDRKLVHRNKPTFWNVFLMKTSVMKQNIPLKTLQVASAEMLVLVVLTGNYLSCYIPRNC